jgi:tetrahydromethanopterin S-methyltransferase subunit G
MFLLSGGVETEAQIQHDSELSFEKVWAMFQESDRKFEETRKEIKKSQKATQKIVSDLGQKFGAVVEHMFIPNLHIFIYK